MVIRICLISTMFIFFTAVSNKHEGNFNQKRITVIGKAVVMKHYAAVRTDDSVFYFLEGKDDWDDKHLGKRVKVSGRLYIKEWHDAKKSENPEITAIPQQRYGAWKMLKKPRWSLVE
ncbi:MAG TPA: hypothetical protein PLX17_05215 [Chitinophagaceae bacterium]|nr:hypothetical protein [Chitinophagaceae bacterium]